MFLTGSIFFILLTENEIYFICYFTLRVSRKTEYGMQSFTAKYSNNFPCPHSKNQLRECLSLPFVYSWVKRSANMETANRSHYFEWTFFLNGSWLLFWSNPPRLHLANKHICYLNLGKHTRTELPIWVKLEMWFTTFLSGKYAISEDKCDCRGDQALNACYLYRLFPAAWAPS